MMTRPARATLSLLAGLVLSASMGLAQQAPPAPAPAKPPAGNQQGGRIKIGVRLVNVVFSVTDKHHRFVTDLDKKDFRVFEDGDQEAIDFFSRQTDLPLRIALLLDTSNSIRARLQFEQEAATDFLYNVIRPGKDLALLMTFDDQPEIVQDYTDDKETLANAIRKQRAGGGTALYDAVYFACQRRLETPPLPPGENPEVRRVVVVISDGEDNESDHARSEAFEMAERAGVAIYTISTSTDWLALDQGDLPKKLHLTGGDKVLQEMAANTGGRAFYPYRIDDLAQSFLDIGNELRSQYSLGYTPSHPPDGKFHKIRVEVARKGVNLRSRKGYFAAVASPPASKSASPPGH